MSKIFKYDILKLIELVEENPCLWDKTADSFKDKITKQKAWKEICSDLDSDFLAKPRTEQEKIGEAIITKWQNIRDSFIKSIKKRPKSNISKKYLYHDYLQFLLKETSDNHNENLIENQLKSEDMEPESTTKTRKKLRLDIEDKITDFNSKTGQKPDEDEAFFISILPTVQKMSEEDKLEFRIHVLQFIKNIKNSQKI